MDAFGQVEVTPVGGSQVGMPLRVVQEQEGASAQHFACAPDEAAWNQVIAVNRLAVAIHVEGRWLAVGFCPLDRPKLAGPGRQGIGKGLLSTGTCQLGQEAFSLPETVGPPSPREQPQGITCIPAQITGASQSDRREKEQSQQRLAACGGRRVG